ncbi:MULTISPECIES: hypothetical protein [unclassified Haloarcula]|uniref:hypothetical protein n=1 Tax=unclassified Haloarcula TaxID=2624677 RepID=UPI001245B498|nr:MULTISPECIES: hypothetical protein [unclassified Haloarcula]
MTEGTERATVRRIVEIDPGALAVLSGAITGLTGAVAYFLLPLVTSEYVINAGGRDAFEITLVIIDFFLGQSLLYHGGVLVLVPFVTTAVALSLARRGGNGGRSTDVAVITMVAIVPFVTVWLGAIIAWVAIASQHWATALFGIVIAFGVATGLSICVAIVMGVSALGAYALVKRVGPQPSD